MTTLLHPEASRQPRVTFQAGEIAEYLKRLKEGPALAAPDFNAIADADIRAAAEKEFNNVRDNFKRDNLLAGAELMSALVAPMQLEGKTLIFDRDSSTAWLRARLDPGVVIPSEEKLKRERERREKEEEAARKAEEARKAQESPVAPVSTPAVVPATSAVVPTPVPVSPSPAGRTLPSSQSPHIPGTGD